MATAVSFNGTSIQSSNIKIKDIEHEAIDNKETNIQRLSARDGGKIIDPIFAPRSITLRGTIIGSTQADLESRIDSFKQLLNGQEKNLDIAYAASTRRYRVTVSNVKVTRTYYHVTFAEWEATFVASDPPFGFATDTNTIEYSAVTQAIGTWVSSATFVGTYRPLPIIRLTVNSETALEQINFTNSETGQTIRVAPSGGYTAGDVLIINTADYTVTLNGVAVDYTGVLPEFIQGDNDFRVGFSGTAWNVTLSFIFYPLYL